MLTELAKTHGVVLLYHATFTTVPEQLAGGLHNITPAELASQLDEVARYFTFVDVDTFAAAIIDDNDASGLVSVTFDDGYRCVAERSLQVFEERNIPFTMYLNGRTLTGQPFWRDKVRAIVASGLDEAFTQTYPQFKNPQRKAFYRYSKHPSNPSNEVEKAIDEFMQANGLDVSRNAWCLNNVNELPDHPLISYGNHGYSHYVMSSLDEKTQTDEVEKTQSILEHLPNHNISRMFSMPFGGSDDYNKITEQVVVNAGFSAMLMSRAGLNRHQAGEQTEKKSRIKLPLIERFMPKSGAIAAQLISTCPS